MADLYTVNEIVNFNKGTDIDWDRIPPFIIAFDLFGSCAPTIYKQTSQGIFTAPSYTHITELALLDWRAIAGKDYKYQTGKQKWVHVRRPEPVEDKKPEVFDWIQAAYYLQQGKAVQFRLKGTETWMDVCYPCVSIDKEYCLKAIQYADGWYPVKKDNVETVAKCIGNTFLLHAMNLYSVAPSELEWIGAKLSLGFPSELTE